MFSTYILLDYENVQPADMALLKVEHFVIYIFLGCKQDKISFELAASVQEFGKRVNYIKANASGTNALDFYITYYLGQLVLKDPKASFRIISKDTGFDALIQHLQTQNITVSRVENIQGIFRKIPKTPLLSTPPQKQPSKTNPDQPKAQAETQAQAKTIQDQVKTTPSKAQKQNATQTKVESNRDKIITFLQKIVHPPKTQNALKNSIKEHLGNALPEKELTKIVKQLEKQKIIRIENEKVRYSL